MDNVVSFNTFADTIGVTTANCTDGTATVYPYGFGVPPFTYLWSNGATSVSVSGLSTGFYSVTVKDAIGCTDNVTAFVPQSLFISAAVSATDATCSASDGTISAVGIGGTAPYSYVWSNGATTASQIGLTGGLYDVNVMDANGCIGNAGGTIGTASPISVIYTVTPSLCTAPTGSVTLIPSGGTAPYTAQWITTPAQTGMIAINLIYGTYTYHVTDATGCVQTGTAYIPPMDLISASYMSTPALCTLSNGSMTVYPTGGVAPYFYLWNTGATTATITGKPAGNYSVTITDALGCKATENAYLPFNSPVTVGLTTTPASCVFANDGIDSAVVWGGTPPYAYSWSTGGSTSSISALASGPYWVSVTDAAGCNSHSNYSYVGYDPSNTDCYCTISGTVYADANSSCTQDPGEAGIPNIQIYISGRGFTYTDANGNYSYKVPPGTYSVSETVPAFYPLSPCQINNVTVIAGSGAGCVNTVNFGNNVIPTHDMHISTWNYSSAVPGQTYSNVTLVSNDGTVAEDSIVTNYQTDGHLYVPTFVPVGVFSGSSNAYTTIGSFPALTPGATMQFFMNYIVPTNIPLGTTVVFNDTVSYNSPIDDWMIDNTPANNISACSTITSKSYNPNFKSVFPTGTGPAGIIAYSDSVLEYMIHFQNTGDAMTDNIMIADTLDDNLDWTSLKPEFMSAPCQVTLTQVGTKKIAQFMFNHIDLPTSASDEVRSNGMLTYSIHTKNGLSVGSQFRNKASIYFDYNAPVVTNTTLNTLGSLPTKVNNVPAAANTAFSVFPNPANETFKAIIVSDASGKADLTIADVAGRVVMNRTLSLQAGTQTMSVDVSQFASGVYFVSLNQNGKVQTQKLVIVK